MTCMLLNAKQQSYDHDDLPTSSHAIATACPFSDLIRLRNLFHFMTLNVSLLTPDPTNDIDRSLQASGASTLQSLMSQSPNGMLHPNTEVPSCCCGRIQCAYLARNTSALEGLERDLRSAAQIGQVCFTQSIRLDLIFRHPRRVLDVGQVADLCWLRPSGTTCPS